LALSEAHGERMFQRGSRLLGIRFGQYRTPFGLSSRSDHAYSGFLRAPLIRYDGYWALTNSFRERRVDVIVGTPRLFVEASLGAPGDIGIARRRAGVERVVRVQSYLRSVIVGVSHINSEPYLPRAAAPGRLTFTGIDAAGCTRASSCVGNGSSGSRGTAPILAEDTSTRSSIGRSWAR
jgi:hypothetical protein